MKPYLLFLTCIFICCFSCRQAVSNNEAMQLKIDSLQQQLNNAYKPGLGEFMSGIQVHHAKLWFAGKSGNWKLADFELHEIMEAVEDIQHYANDRVEVKELPMLLPALDSLNNAVKKQDKSLFSNNFILLTNTCNNCHTAVNYEFNKVKIPDNPPYSNQVFEVK